ncbi:glutamyl-tRNA(Gln) amidotransferase subunit C, mitochondrial [Athalia rosae]|uniref:glutamyl-tRNA(Gln) amidotransferase subunit C, mitochondrial n=1 Tax=Athalia rosae TaxID=37344 RepID=UPI002033D6A1|nr:glutamyl-tRNA(Gln) amidotransferase subunit C, mitochondrial [Athalia rosae]
MEKFVRIICNTCKRKYQSRYYATKFSEDVEKIAPTVNDISIEQLERLSLVNFGSKEGIARLRAAIHFADQLRSIKLEDDIQPMYTVLENEKLYLREDKVSDGGYAKKVLKNAALTEEGYFVAPPGNVPVDLTDGKI